MKKILLSLAALTMVSGSIQPATAGGIGVSVQLGAPAAYYYPPQRVYRTVAPVPYYAAPPVYYAQPAPPVYYAQPAPVLVYSQPVCPAPVVVRPSGPICI